MGLSMKEDNYEESISILKNTNARGRFVVLNLVIKLAKLLFAKNDGSELHGIYDTIYQVKGPLESNDVLVDEENDQRFVLPILEEKISGSLRENSDRYVNTLSIENITLEDFLKHIQLSARITESRPIKINTLQDCRKRRMNIKIM
ncbi:unnamed protein product [Lepeophtheirus salmonis]|uniref:(salmon louse) hypothetical protein n=1 Tax=Lepeophtheirus salmonis TaxID=72036 RepID=A0A7R8D5K3_LEPSM|nr:unnamed protein product [Lepeophtheirus salmonis]CAF3007153.1 unnamed protein product [Lepeophtheirus salmonis]